MLFFCVCDLPQYGVLLGFKDSNLLSPPLFLQFAFGQILNPLEFQFLKPTHYDKRHYTGFLQGLNKIARTMTQGSLSSEGLACMRRQQSQPDSLSEAPTELNDLPVDRDTHLQSEFP